MKAKFKIIPAIILLTAGLAFNAAAQSGNPVETTATATATIITPLTLANGGDMNFGTITATALGGTVEMTPGGARTALGVQLPATTGIVSAASFTVGGDSNYAYTVTLPSDHILTKVSSTEVMTLGTFTSSLTLNSGALIAGAGSFTVGSTLTIGANQVSGTYTNASGFTVSVVYN